MKIAIYPGTFDPVTNGHIDILERALKLFDKVIITIARNTVKNPLFTEEERITLLRQVTKSYKNVVVDSFEGFISRVCAEEESHFGCARLARNDRFRVRTTNGADESGS